MKDFIKKIKKLIKAFNEKPLKVRVISAVSAVLVFAVLFWGGCELFGYPITKIKVISGAKAYISENMPDMEYKRSICKYSFKNDFYYIDFTPDGWSRAFRLTLNEDGKVIRDGYTIEYMYSEIYNTL